MKCPWNGRENLEGQPRCPICPDTPMKLLDGFCPYYADGECDAARAQKATREENARLRRELEAVTIPRMDLHGRLYHVCEKCGAVEAKPAPEKERPRCIGDECASPGGYYCIHPGGPVPKEEAKCGTCGGSGIHAGDPCPECLPPPAVEPPVVEVGQVWVHKRSGERLLIIPRESVDRMKTACKDGVLDPDADFGYRCLSGTARGTEGAVRPSGLLRYYTIEPRIPNPALVQARHDLRRAYDEACESLTREFQRLMAALDGRGE